MSTKDFSGSYPTGITLSVGGSTSATIESGATVGGDTAFLTQYSLAVENHGTITGGSFGVSLDGGSLTNAVGGSISASLTAVYGQQTGAPVTIDNAGSINGNNGVILSNGGALTNEATGSIWGGNTGAYNNGVIVNAGMIGGTDGVLLGGAGSLTNEVGGTISGSVYGVYAGVPGSDVTVENAGNISGTTDAIDFTHSGNHRLIIDAGATFTGDVVAGSAGSNTIELSAKNGPGTISEVGVHYKGFQTITIDAGATWTVAGTMAGIGASTIGGFDTTDRIDLTDLSFDAGDTVTINHGNDVLTIKDAAGEVLDLVKLSGNLSFDVFHLADDGTANHGTVITEEFVPCFCRGTLIMTPNGEVAVEDLNIGDLVMTMHNGAQPIKWIGTRGYDGRFIRDGLFTLPICLKQGAIGRNVPTRDLWVSPGHAICLQGVLVPAWLLINGTSIYQARHVDQVEYFHIELENHAVLFADGCPAESFLDDDCRGQFHNAGEFVALYPFQDNKPVSCLPRVEDGFALRAIQEQLAERAGQSLPPWQTAGALRGFVDQATGQTVSGWAQCETQPEAPVCLDILVDGKRVMLALANRYRADLREAGLGSGRHAFEVNLPAGMSGKVEVRRSADGAVLTPAFAMLTDARVA
jgi:hypothetical protein